MNREHAGTTAGGAACDALIVGAGISGLALAHRLSRLRPRWQLRVLEAEREPGGTMRSETVDGCICEWGPNGFLTNVEYTTALAREVGLEERLLEASPAVNHRYLYVDGRLHAVRPSPLHLLRSGLLSWPGKLRLFSEPFRRPRSNGGDESVHAFAERRIGREAAEVLVDAMVSGIHAADPRQLSLPAAFPRMAELEREHGTLTRAMRATRKRPGSGGPAGPGGRLTSFPGGMGELPAALGRALGERLTLGARVTGVERADDGFRVTAATAGGDEVVVARRLVLAVPAFAAAALLRELPEVHAPLNRIEYAPITVASLIYNRAQVSHPLHGFGFLVPHGQGPRMLGCIWVGSIFPRQVPSDRVLLRVMLGGARRPGDTELSDEDTVRLAHGELAGILGIEGAPRETVLFRHRRGIPQYTLGHLDRVRAAEEAAARVGELYLTGNAYRGIGVNDCVREAGALARHMAGAAPEDKDGTLGGSS